MSLEQYNAIGLWLTPQQATEVKIILDACWQTNAKFEIKLPFGYDEFIVVRDNDDKGCIEVYRTARDLPSGNQPIGKIEEYDTPTDFDIAYSIGV